MTHHDLNETDLEDKIEQTPVFAECNRNEQEKSADIEWYHVNL